MTGEGYTKKLGKTVGQYAYVYMLWNVLLLLLVGSVLHFYTSLADGYILLGLMATAFISSYVFARIMTRLIVKPMEYLTNAILHISPSTSMVPPPELGTLRVGTELVSELTRHLYDFATSTQATVDTSSTAAPTVGIEDLPIAIIGLDKEGNIQLCNPSAQEIFGPDAKPLGQRFEAQLNINLPNGTIGDWYANVSTSSVHAQNIWRKSDVRSQLSDNRGYYDIAAHYRKDHPSGIELLLVFSEQNNVFQAEDSALSLIALAVHEIRTPLTIMRGNLEVLEEELLATLTPEMQEYLQRTLTSSQSLNGFINNILGVARADQDQLTLNLRQESWQTILPGIIDMLRQRTEIRGKTIELEIADGIPSVALDSVSISEVLTNLVENAIKYSTDEGKIIRISTKLDSVGMVETTVTDQGLGIPDSVVPNLFNKFSRNHRNSGHITGTGLGLFLCKAIVNAHHGNIWVSSKEGQGTTIGFTLLPYDKLAESTESADNTIIRSKHGWIKNHSMQRR